MAFQPLKHGLVQVHPRVGGERQARLLEHKITTGSSPRGRGTRAEGLQHDSRLRFIPAWAGNASA